MASKGGDHHCLARVHDTLLTPPAPPMADQALCIPLLMPKICISPCSGMQCTGRELQGACSGFTGIQVGINRLSLARGPSL